ncbi:MAG: hypothetical protein M9952_01230 [Microthrixaceae bacterium]|nr:hypothetical protein [Microthrixaceae bacterium]
MRTVLSRTIFAVLLALFSSLGVAASARPASAAVAPCPNENGCVRAITVNGFIDQINADFIRRAASEVADVPGYSAIILVIDSEGSVISAEELNDLVVDLVDLPLKVTAWVGPSGAQALGGAAELVAALEPSMAPNTRIGDVGVPQLDQQRFGDLVTSTDTSLRETVIDNDEAEQRSLSLRTDAILGDHALNRGDVAFKDVTDDEGRPKRELLTTNITIGLPVTTQLLHTAASPAVAYLALAIAIGLLLFEFFTAGVGVAGVVGAICAVMAGYGLAELPLRWWALALCLFSAFAFAIDIQTAIPRLWTLIGLVSWSVGSLFLFDGLRAPWLALLTGLGGMAVLMLSGMPSMVRSRFATPTLGRSWMIGKMGTAISDINPEGTVDVDGGIWRAITNRATPVMAGGELRVVGIDGMTLEIEPPEGGAIDYRDRRPAASDDPGDEPDSVT